MVLDASDGVRDVMCSQEEGFADQKTGWHDGHMDAAAWAIRIGVDRPVQEGPARVCV